MVTSRSRRRGGLAAARGVIVDPNGKRPGYIEVMDGTDIDELAVRRDAALHVLSNHQW